LQFHGAVGVPLNWARSIYRIMFETRTHTTQNWEYECQWSCKALESYLHPTRYSQTVAFSKQEASWQILKIW